MSVVDSSNQQNGTKYIKVKESLSDITGDDDTNVTPIQSWCNNNDYGDINISHSEEAPVSLLRSSPFLSCGLFQQDDIEQNESDATEKQHDEHTEINWAEMIWTLTGMRFIQISCIEPDVLNSLSAHV